MNASDRILQFFFISFHFILFYFNTEINQNERYAFLHIQIFKEKIAASNRNDKNTLILILLLFCFFFFLLEYIRSVRNENGNYKQKGNGWKKENPTIS